MGAANTVLETIIIMKIANLLTQDWKKTDAFKNKIIDANGNVLKKGKLSLIEKFSFNLRKILEKLPGGKLALTKYFSVYFLFKENKDWNGLFEEEINTNRSILYEDIRTDT